MVNTLRTHTKLTEAPDPRTVPSHEGGAVFEVSPVQMLMRFLLTGTEDSSLYANAKETTLAHVASLETMLAEGTAYMQVFKLAGDISLQGRAPKNDYAIYVLAVGLTHPRVEVRQYAAEWVQAICRTGAHIEMLTAFILDLQPVGVRQQVTAQDRAQPGRFATVRRRAIGGWFDAKPMRELALQAIKYQERHDMALRRVMILSHPKGGAKDPERAELFNWIVRRELPAHPAYSSLANFEAWDQAHYGGPQESMNPRSRIERMHPLARVVAFLELRQPGISVEKVANIVSRYDLPREAVPTEFLDEPAVWRALFERMPLTAMVRNLGKMSEMGLLTHRSQMARDVANRLSEVESLRRARLHPMTLYVALRTYAAGHGVRSGKTWTPVGSVADALDWAFMHSFKYVEPTGARLMIAIDTSGSMQKESVNGLPYVKAAEAAAILAMVYAQVDDHHIVAFSHQMVPITLNPNDRVDATMRKLAAIPMGGGTFCSLPIEHALRERIQVDAFVTITDSETSDLGRNRPHPAVSHVNQPTMTVQQALRKYRNTINPRAGNVVVGTSSNRISLADRDDPRQLDLVGLDSDGPSILHESLRAWMTPGA